ncbi:MAG: LysR family transcriptional regulator [Nocardioides sp.]|nr:LysR family transcriptional regulator [Nocardioides sp.]
MNLRLVRYFVAVASELHFGRAAASLYISQPALSKQIRRLEDDIGFPLLVRDSRHVVLTPRGERFLHEARQLLATAEKMTRPEDVSVVRMAHIFELDTSRMLVDAVTAASPDIRVAESSMDGIRQLEALMLGQLDVAILRVTAGLVARHPTGWHHRLLRLEPFWLVGRPGEEPAAYASFHGRPIEVFADGPDSPLYNAHGQYMTALEQETGVTLSWLGNPGTFENCHAMLTRRTQPGYVLEFDSYARRYAERGLPIHRPAELQPVYPFSIAWRDGEPTEAVARFVQIALATARGSGWLERVPAMSPQWSPAADPVRIDNSHHVY